MFTISSVSASPSFQRRSPETIVFTYFGRSTASFNGRTWKLTESSVGNKRDGNNRKMLLSFFKIKNSADYSWNKMKYFYSFCAAQYQITHGPVTVHGPVAGEDCATQLVAFPHIGNKKKHWRIQELLQMELRHWTCSGSVDESVFKQSSSEH